ncbi:MAG: LysR family transcriptional regulator, partial [Hyphomicrobiaceae bacterium]
MDWDNIRTFLAVARRNQFLAAGQLLRVNQATVARRVAALEAALGSTLFERSTTGVTLTDAGKRLMVHAERVESELLQAEADIRQQDLQLSGTVRIGAPDGFSTYFLVPALRTLA